MLIDGKEINSGRIRTNDRCIGCNRCIGVCPVFGANIAVECDDKNRLLVDPAQCIECGRCLDICPHQAREYLDDTDRFLDDLRGGKRNISLLVDPSFALNYPQKYDRLLGYLQHIGVRHIADVALGADIATWAYLNHIARGGEDGLIAPTCTAIVNRIEKHHPQLVDKLVPVQSPMMCTAIYLRKYAGIEDAFAFLSPCIAKKSEMVRHGNLIEYNVAFERLVGALDQQDLGDYRAECDPSGSALGALFPTHGGLKANIEHYAGVDADFLIDHQQGMHAHSFLQAYATADDACRAQLTDVVHCAHNCACGTATAFRGGLCHHIAKSIHRARAKALPQGAEPSAPAQRLDALNRRFAALRPEDFAAQYAARGEPLPQVSRRDLERAFRQMMKYTRAHQRVDCGNCGHASCRQMAGAIALRRNHLNNCTHYLRKKLEIERSASVAHGHLLAGSSPDEPRANIDHLTGLPNRYLFEQSLERMLKGARRSGRACCLIAIDLDDFMAINESYGHNFGDALLTTFAVSLKRQLAQDAQVFRAGGDDFFILIEDAPEARAREVADALLSRGQSAWEILGVRLYCTVSIGIVRFPEADDGTNDIIRNADVALYRAKAHGKNTCVVFEKEFDETTHEEADIMRGLRDAVSEGFAGFSLRYQPWVRQGRIIGAEALLRWQYKGGEFVPPATFIPIAEKTGLIIPIGEYVLKHAAEECARINGFYANFLMSINVSARQFSKPDIVDDFLSIIEKTGVDPRNIVLEITENLGLEKIARQKKVFGKFAQRGIQIALDDFGTGYSSLSYLNELPLNLVKIDRAFIRDIETDPYSKYLLDTMTDLMHRMGRRICVEGVETHDQLQHCLQSKVDIVQGFYYYKPMLRDDLDLLIRQQAASGR